MFRCAKLAVRWQSGSVVCRASVEYKEFQVLPVLLVRKAGLVQAARVGASVRLAQRDTVAPLV
jgi:hypothetical protein